MRRVRVKKLYADFEAANGRRPRSSRCINVERIQSKAFTVRELPIFASERRHLKRDWMLARGGKKAIPQIQDRLRAA